MTLSNQQVYEGAHVKFLKKGTATATSPRPARIVVSPGKIEIISTENRFPTIYIKPSDLTKQPKRPQGKSVSWISLDFVQTIDAKYQYVNIQVDMSNVDRVVDILLHAWSATKTRTANALFSDNADDIMRPVHTTTPNAVSRQTKPADRQARVVQGGRIKVDEEGSASLPAHGAFNNDFNPQRRSDKALEMKGMFEEYGISDGKGSQNVAPAPVHKKAPPKKNGNTLSYAAQAKKNNTCYRPVDTVADKLLEKRAGLNDKSFYGNNKPSALAVLKDKYVNANRSSTKDMLDSGSFGASSRVTVTKGTRPSNLHESSMREQRAHAGLEDDDNENAGPSREKSVTSASTSYAKIKPHNIFDELSPLSPPRASSSCRSNTNQVARSTSMMDSHSSNGWKWEKKEEYANRKQKNIGNSCYMNSTMQVLAACPIFVEHLDKAHESLPNKSETMRRFTGLMRRLTGAFGPETVKSELLYKMRDCLRRLDAIFDENDGSAQQDAEECLTALLGAISDECTGNGFKKRDSSSRRSITGGSPVKNPTPIKRIQESDSMEEESIEKEGEKVKKMPAVCDPVDLMEVNFRDVKRCKNCGDTNEKPGMEHRVHLSIQEEKEGVPWTVKCLQQLLAAEVAIEEIIGDFKCEHCNTKTEAIGTKFYIRFGEYIIIVLKRFGYNENHQLRKVNTPTRVPVFLEMADFIQGDKTVQERHPLDETITISDDKKSIKMKRKSVDVTSPTVRVADKTNHWLEGEEKEEDQKEKARVEVISQQSHASVELIEEKKEKKEEEGEVMEEEEESEGGITTAREGEGEEKREAAGKEEGGDSIEILSPASPDAVTLTEAAVPTVPSVPSVPSTPSTTAAAPLATPFTPIHDLSSSLRPSSTLADRHKHRLETPASVKEQVRSRIEVEKMESATPSRKRTRQRPSRVKEEGQEWLSTDSRRSSFTHSEPSIREKKSRLDEGGRRSSNSFSLPPDEVTIVDSDEEEKKRRRESGEKKPCWTIQEEPKKDKRESTGGDEYAFDAEGEEEGAIPIKKEKEKGDARKTRTPFKMPLKTQNRLHKKEEEESPVKGRTTRGKEKTENIVPSPMKPDMEQKGGGRIESSSDDDAENKKHEKEEEEEGEGMEIDKREGEQKMEMEEGDEDRRYDHVTRRSKRRTRTMYETNEGTDHGVDDEEAKDEMMKNEKEDGSQEGGFIKKEEEEEESSADEIVPSTPPDEMEEEGKREAAGREENEDELGLTEEDEDEMDEQKKRVTEGDSLQDEDDVFGNTVDNDLTPPMIHPPTPIKPSRKDEDLDGMVLPPSLSPPISPVKAEEDISKKKEDSDDDEMKEEEKKEMGDVEKEHAKRVRGDNKRGEWRKLFIDTDPPPPRDHIIFRPVDDRWMRNQSAQLGLKCELTKWDNDGPMKVFARLRAQSNLCKVSDKPSYTDTLNIDGDGNCLFRALAWWVSGTEENHEIMRKKIVKFMINFPNEFGTRMSGPAGQKYTKESSLRMLNDGEWGTQCEIYGAATLLGVDIYTYHESKWKPYRPLFEWTFADGFKVTRLTALHERTRYGLYLENDNNLHYDVVKYMEPVAPVTDTCYRLLGSILHHGSYASSGHYIADVYDQKEKQWLHCDDSSITKTSVIEVLENAMDHGYVLVYGKNKSMMKK